jgi:hypothetical protein
MGFIPLPLICLVNSLGDLLRKMSSSLFGVSLQVWRTLSQSFSFPGSREAAVVATVYLCLTSVKVVVGILLLHGARSYCEDRKSSTGAASSNESSPCPHGSETSSGVAGDVIIVGGEEGGVRQRSSSAAARKTEKQRSLSEVERYTLVSNRIV